MKTTTIRAPEGLPIIEIEREFDAPRDLVFRAHVEPDLLVQWLGPRGMLMTVDYLEPEDGGRWRYVHRDTNGTYAFHGVFHGDPAPERIVQTFEFEGAPGHVSLDTLMLDDLGERTRLRTLSVYQSVADRDAMVESGMEVGVNDGYERLDELLAGQMRGS